MGEGEFKKRINAMCPPAEEVFLPEKGEEIFGQSEVLNLIDEARKEFPMPEQMLRVFGGQIKPSDLGSLGKLNPLEMAKWFLKWFGDQ